MSPLLFTYYLVVKPVASLKVTLGLGMMISKIESTLVSKAVKLIFFIFPIVGTPEEKL